MSKINTHTAVFIKGNLICVIKKAQMQNLKINKTKNLKRYLVDDALCIDFKITQSVRDAFKENK